MTHLQLFFALQQMLVLQAWLCGMQDQGTAIWLFAYFGYWLEIFVVIAFKVMSGSLLVAGVRKKQLKQPVLPKTADSLSTSSEDSTVKAVDIPKGKEVQPSDFIVGADSMQHKGKAVYEEQAECSGSSGSSNSTQQQHVELADMQARP